MFDKKEYMKEYCKDNSERMIKYNKQWRIDNREKKLKQNGRYYQRYKDRMIKEAKEYYLKNHENMLKKAKEYLQNNKEKILKYRRGKYKMDLKFNINQKIRRDIYRSLKSNKAGRHWETLVNYSLKDLIKRLKQTMPKGYAWQDYLDGKLQIDHKIPISAFNYTKPENPDFKRCWALKNLQLLPARENLIKSNHLEKPFQPALKICLVD